MPKMSDDSLAYEEKLELSSWGLPEHILQKYLMHGVKKMFPWQVECLMSGDVLLGGNLIYSAPTSAGKTLVAEILAIKTIIERKKKVIVILPFVSVVREKMIYFQEIFSGSGIRVDGFMGSYNPPGGFRAVHLAICTIEKANNLINRLLEERNLDDIGTIIVDELHLLGDPHRGYLLELLLTKLKYICLRGLCANIQIIGMSATLPNLDLLASWMNATLYHTDFRPIPLHEYLKIGRSVYKSSGLDHSFDIKPIIDIKNDPEDVIYLCLDTIMQGYSLLVFCPAKNWCETLAVQISTEIKKIGNEKNTVAASIRNQLNSSGISDILEQLKKCPVGLEKNLGQSVSFGVAYHHAGLTLDERDIIEGGFKQNIIRVLVATSTLSSGVNLPARRVIIRSPGFQGHCMDIMTYKQMIGRAGRMGKDSAGESYLICTESDKVWGRQLLSGTLPAVESCLGKGNLSNSLKRALLEVLACGIVSSSAEVQDYTKCTLLAASSSEDKMLQAIDSCTNYLQDNEFIKINLDGSILPSSLAEACLSASVPPDQALYLLRELHKARQCFVLDSDLHAIYQVTPYSICDYWAVDWMRVFTIWENLAPNLQKIGELIGVEDRFLIKAMRGTINLNADEHIPKISIHKRFYTALALQDLINEVPLNSIVAKYDCNKGMLQSLQQSASTFAAMVTCFCKRLGWGGLEVLLSELSTRIQFGVQKDLLDLLRLDCMTALIARGLFNASITSIAELASSTLSSVQTAISKGKPFQSELISKNLKEKKNVYLPGRPGLSEAQAADLLIQEARKFLLKEMGVKTALWETSGINLTDKSVYNSTTIYDDEDQNTKSESFDVKKNECNKLDSSIENQINRAEEFNDGKHDGIETTNVEPTNHNLGKDVFVSDINKTDDTGDQELNIVKTQDPETKNKTLQETIFSSVLGNKKCDRKNLSSFENNDAKEITNVKSGSVIDLKELDDTELVDSQFISNVAQTSRFALNNSHRLQNMLEGKTKQSNLNGIGCTTSNFIENCNLSSFGIFEAEKEIEISQEALKIDYPQANSSFKSTMAAYSSKNNNSLIRLRNTPIAKLEMSYSSPIMSDKDLKATTVNLEQKPNPLNVNSNCSTPVTIHGQDDANLSNNDMFSESPLLHPSNISVKIDSIKNQTLEDFDINWGGDSLIEYSQIETKFLETYNKKDTLKRKLVDSIEEFNYSKKKCLRKEEEYVSKEPVNISNFQESMILNTQIENILNTKETTCNKVIMDRNKTEVLHKPNNENLKMKNRAKSEGHLSKSKIEIKAKRNFTGALLSDIFGDKFKRKFSEMLAEDINTEKDSVDLLDLSISDSEDFITGSPEESQKHKKDFSLNRNFGNSKVSSVTYKLGSPAKITSKSSPAKCASPSPRKYPPIGDDIVKMTKSPSSIKKLIGTPGKLKSSSVKCLMSEYSKGCDSNLPVVNIDNRNNDVQKIINIILCSKEMSFAVKTKKICENGSAQNKIGSKIIKAVSNIDTRTQYPFKYCDEAIDGIYLFDGKTVYNFDTTVAGEKNMLLLAEIFSQEYLKLCGINIKKILKLLHHCCNVNIKCKLFDIGVADWLLDPQEKHKPLNELAKEFLNRTFPCDSNSNSSICQELVILRDLQIELSKRLRESNLEKLFIEVEMPIQMSLLYMELTGIGFDHNIPNELWSLATELMGKLEMEAFTLAKQKFSLNSNADLTKVKKNLKLFPDQEANSPLIQAVQNWRKLFSLKTKNLSQLLFIKNTRCYCNSSTKTVTGRIMMYDPDLQHIQRDFIVYEKLFSLRSAFPARNENVLVSADYSQLELRILAHFSQDPVLLPLLRKNDDVFKSIAAEWNGISAETVNEEMRHQVKQICYGIIYGMGDKALGEALGKTAAESSMLSANFKRTFPKLDDFIKSTIAECRQAGKIKTLAGRVRYLPAINSNIPQSRAQAERQAINSKIQGSAADIAKKAMVEIEARLNKKFPYRKLLPTDYHSSHLVIQLHDELIFEVSEALQDSFVGVLKDVMETATVLTVPLPVVIKVGKSWGSLKKI